MLALLVVASTALITPLPQCTRAPHQVRPILLLSAKPPIAIPAPLAPTATFVALHAALRRVLFAMNIQFPAPIIGMIGGFLLLCALPQSISDKIDAYFEPACRLFRDWLAAIFSPGFTFLLTSHRDIIKIDPTTIYIKIR